LRTEEEAIAYIKAKFRAKENGIPTRTFYHRLENGWTLEDACSRPRYYHPFKKSLNERNKIRIIDIYDPLTEDELNEEIVYRTKKKEWKD
jgi:hypothetical protein